jgi:hypothetical protein
MKIYHYTKSIKLNSIFEDGFIATEMKRTLGNGKKLTDYVWLTEKTSYPKTALPLVPMFPETSLIHHLQHKGLHVNLDKISEVVGKFYRFGFDSADTRLKKWYFSAERRKMQNNFNWLQMEKVANKVGDNIHSFWIANEDLKLENFSLEVYEGGWKVLLDNVSISNIQTEDKKTIEALKELSITKCKEFNLPHSNLLVA